MQREILFRGKTLHTNEWVEGDLIHGLGAKHGKTYIFPTIINLAYIKTKAKPHHIDGYEVHPETVGQYTGLTDKNGVKVFKGDLITIGNDTFGDITGEDGLSVGCEVKTQGCDYVLYRNDIGLQWGRLSRVEELNWSINLVIGNIHEGGNNG